MATLGRVLDNGFCRFHLFSDLFHTAIKTQIPEEQYRDRELCLLVNPAVQQRHTQRQEKEAVKSQNKSETGTRGGEGREVDTNVRQV